MLNEIIKLADHLDMIGEKEEASLLDEILPYIKNIEVDMAESDDEEESHGVNYMLESQLTSISKKTSAIKSMIESGAEVDDWMETYIAQADLMIDNIYDSRDGTMSITASYINLTGTAGSAVNQIDGVGSYSVTFNFLDIAGNGLDGVILNLTITS